MKNLSKKIEDNPWKAVFLIMFICFGPGPCAVDIYETKISPPGGVGHAYDVITGKPLADAWVIAKYHGDTFDILIPGSHRSSGQCRKGIVIKTDEGGRFDVPDWGAATSRLYLNKTIEIDGYKPGYQLAYHGSIKLHGADRNKLLNLRPYEFKEGNEDVFFLPIYERFTTESWLVALKGFGQDNCGSARYDTNYQDMYKDAYQEAIDLLATVDKNSPDMKVEFRPGFTHYNYIESTPDDVCNYGLGIHSNFTKRWPDGCPWPKIPKSFWQSVIDKIDGKEW